MQRLFKKLARDQAGITGLETAIILIAFVVVASVFAYTVLSAGLFSSEKGKEAIYEGLDTVRSSIELVGGVVAEDTSGNDSVNVVSFVVANALNGEAIDFTVAADSDFDGLLSDEATRTNTTVISLIDTSQRIDDLSWTQSQLGRGDDDSLLETGEKFAITVFTTGLTGTLVANDQFTLEVKPDTGAALIFERTLPANIETVMDLR